MFQNIIDIIVLTVINTGSIFLLIIIVANSTKDPVHRWLSVMTVTILGWVNFAYLGYVEPNSSLALLFYNINGAFVAFFLFAEYMLYIESFLKIVNRIFRAALFVICLTFSILFLLTDLMIVTVTRQEWGNEFTFGPGYELFSTLVLLINLVVVILLITRYFKLPSIERRKVAYFLVGTFLAIFLNIVFNILLPDILGTVRYQHFGDYAAIFFIIFTAVAILRRKFMNVKIALTSFLIGIVGMLLVVDILALSNNLLEQAIKLIILVFFVGISVLLVRGVVKEIKQREELEKAYKQVQGLRQHEQDMIDIMGHELRTPITIVRNSLGVMEMEFKKNGTIPQEKLARYLDIAMESARREVRLVETLLSSAKADSRGFQLMFEKVDVLDVVNDSLELFKKEGAKKGVDVLFNTTGEFLAYADRIRTQEIVDNLLSNAVKYTDKGKVEVSLIKDENNLTIEVADTGIGMTEDDIKKLGKKFYRVDQYITKANEKPEETKQVIRPGGTGLGLYVAFSLTKIMDGSYEVQSELGKGSKFIIRLPLYNGQLNMQEQRKVEDDEVE